jgi:cytosine deaminase
MEKEKVIDAARQRLVELPAHTEAASRWREFLRNYDPLRGRDDDAHAWLACCLAWEAVAAGNFGVGAILVDAAGRVIVQGHNEMFHPRFRSDRHAEMVVLDRWEDGDRTPSGGTLVTSIEPCPMCLVRLSSSAVRRVLYVAPDLTGGMVRRMDALPPYWFEAAREKSFTQANCSAGLIRAAEQIFLLNLKELTARMKAQ